jgi:hypothetical protein
MDVVDIDEEKARTLIREADEYVAKKRAKGIPPSESEEKEIEPPAPTGEPDAEEPNEPE